MTAPRELWFVKHRNGKYVHYYTVEDALAYAEIAPLPAIAVRLYEHPPVPAPSPDDKLRRLRDAYIDALALYAAKEGNDGIEWDAGQAAAKALAAALLARKGGAS